MVVGKGGVQMLIPLPMIRAPLSSSFGDHHAGRRACETRCCASGRGGGQCCQGECQEAGGELLDSTIGDSWRHRREPIFFSCSSGSGLAPTKRAAHDQPLLFALTLFIIPLSLTSRWHSPYPLPRRSMLACVRGHLLCFFPLPAVISRDNFFSLTARLARVASRCCLCRPLSPV